MYRKEINTQHLSLRNLFKLDVTQEEYRMFTYFVWVKELKSNIPGTKSMYIMHNGGIAIATNAICINEWCYEHNLDRRRPLTQRSVENKIKLNGTNKIDNRTEKWSTLGHWPGYNNKGNCVIARSGDEIRELIWDMYVNKKMSAGEIAIHFGCSPPNVYYHLKRKQKELDKTLI